VDIWCPHGTFIMDCTENSLKFSCSCLSSSASHLSKADRLLVMV